MNIEEMNEKRHWYQEPWVWLLIALPASAVIGGIITIYLAITTSDGLVEDDYYKRGKAINLELARDKAAARHQLQAIIGVDSHSGQVSVMLESRDQVYPGHVSLLLLHPTRAGQDQLVLLEPAGEGAYSSAVSPLAPGDWHVQLETDDWRLSGRVHLPREEAFRLVPQDIQVSGQPASP